VKLSYGSVAAFLAHYDVLRRASALEAEDSERLKVMTEIIESLGTDAAALKRDSPETTRDRHRERAERHLRRGLESRGVLSD
jgi:hypothetical protein